MKLLLLILLVWHANAARANSPPSEDGSIDPNHLRGFIAHSSDDESSDFNPLTLQVNIVAYNPYLYCMDKLFDGSISRPCGAEKRRDDGAEMVAAVRLLLSLSTGTLQGEN